jgi:hypothetical protein
MNLKLTGNELHSIINSLSFTKEVTFNTQLEKNLSAHILSDFAKLLLKRAINLDKKYSIKLDAKTLLVLNHVLPQIYPTNAYDLSVMTRIIKDVNQACLSI